jgi:hypothetical protein
MNWQIISRVLVDSKSKFIFFWDLSCRYLVSQWKNVGVLCDCKRSFSCSKWKNVPYSWKVNSDSPMLLFLLGFLDLGCILCKNIWLLHDCVSCNPTAKFSCSRAIARWPPIGK